MSSFTTVFYDLVGLAVAGFVAVPVVRTALREERLDRELPGFARPSVGCGIAADYFHDRRRSSACRARRRSWT